MKLAEVYGVTWTDRDHGIDGLARAYRDGLSQGPVRWSGNLARPWLFQGDQDADERAPELCLAPQQQTIAPPVRNSPPSLLPREDVVVVTTFLHRPCYREIEGGRTKEPTEWVVSWLGDSGVTPPLFLSPRNPKSCAHVAHGKRPGSTRVINPIHTTSCDWTKSNTLSRRGGYVVGFL